MMAKFPNEKKNVQKAVKIKIIPLKTFFFYILNLIFTVGTTNLMMVKIKLPVLTSGLLLYQHSPTFYIRVQNGWDHPFIQLIEPKA